jgi:23S rRNA pseudouridine2605 synthase
MLKPLGAEVLRLVRVAIGPLSLGQLPKGGVRQLTTGEKQALDQAMGMVRVPTEGRLLRRTAVFVDSKS